MSGDESIQCATDVDDCSPSGANLAASTSAASELTRALKQAASRLGFNLVGIAPAVTPTGIHEFLHWLEQGYAGEMSYLSRREEAYSHPRHVLDGVRSVIMVGLNYAASQVTPLDTGPTRQRGTAPSDDADEPPQQSASKTMTRVARYAQGRRDYHEVLRERLDQLGKTLQNLYPQCRVRGVVDTAPLLERDFARNAGLGWFGKNTMLINKGQGSWFFLGALLTDVELEYDPPHESSHCGTCTRCLEACPTEAFVGPYVLDARRCISYLTIEHRGPIPLELREGIGDWLFGCDVCQAVCPWNRRAPVTEVPDFEARNDLRDADVLDLLSLSVDEFRNRFRATPLWRSKRAGLLRNAAIVAGNSGNHAAVPVLITVLDDAEPLIRGAAAWALGQLGAPAGLTALRNRLTLETDETVRAEITQALDEEFRAAEVRGHNEETSGDCIC